MATRLPSLLRSPIAFAHRGARAHAPENTIEAFQLARKLGATGLESDVWLTADGYPVLDHDGKVGFLRRKPIAVTLRSDLPDHIVTVEEFYDLCGTDFEFSLDVKDPAAFEATIAAARNAGSDVEERLWLCHPQLEFLLPWRRRTSAKLVDSTRLSRIQEGPEQRANRLRNEGVDAINMRRGDWSGGLITMFHRFERVTFGWDAQHPQELMTLLDAGIDGVYSDHVDRMMHAHNYFYGGSSGDSETEGP